MQRAPSSNLAAQFAPNAEVVCDIGCGRGTTTLRLAGRLAPARLIALNQSQALLDTVHERLTQTGHAVETACADFHHLPLPETSIDVVVAAFCIYHSPHPEQVVAEIARCLQPGGHAVLVTKSADSYHEIDQLMADAVALADELQRRIPDRPGHRYLHRDVRVGSATMTGAVLVKHYATRDRAAAARTHRDWLAGLACGVRLPALRSTEPHQLGFEHLGSSTTRPR